MRILVQRSGYAKCEVEGSITGEIESGIVALVGFTEGDNSETIKYLCKKLVNLRIFPDENGINNLSILDFGGAILSISQFTLYGDASKGNRPSYIKALGGDQASILYKEFNEELRKYVNVEEGIFGADMQITLSNIGPTTILLER